MRTNIDIDDKLMQRAMRSNRTTTKKATIEAALQMLIRINAQDSIRTLRGKFKWEGDLHRSRLDNLEE